jgi:broad specificity phosphatase PhoE
VGSLALVRHGQASFGAADYDRLSDRGEAQARALGVRWAAEPPAAIYTGPMRRQRDTARLARAAATEAGRELPEPVELAGLAELPAFELIARCLPEVAREHPELRALVEPAIAEAREAEDLESRASEAKTRAPHDAAARHRLWDTAFWRVLERWSQGRLELGTLESYATFVARVHEALATILGRHRQPGERVVAVTSGGPIGVALRAALAVDEHAMFALWRVVRNASVTELLWRSRAETGELSLLSFNAVDHLPPALHTFR